VPRQSARYEFEHARHGTLCYLAVHAVFSGRVYGETATGNGIEPFERALEHSLAPERYRQVERIFLIVDNGCALHPRTAPARLQEAHPKLTVHLPTLRTG